MEHVIDLKPNYGMAEPSDRILDVAKAGDDAVLKMSPGFQNNPLILVPLRDSGIDVRVEGNGAALPGLRCAVLTISPRQTFQ